MASKDLIERLTDADADRLGLDRDRVGYSTVAELPGADDKAKRDAGGVAVADITVSSDSDHSRE